MHPLAIAPFYPALRSTLSVPVAEPPGGGGLNRVAESRDCSATVLTHGVASTGSRGTQPLGAVGVRQPEGGSPLATEAHLDDLAWVARVQEGDESAAKVLIDRLYPTIIKSVRYRLPRRTSEEDLVQAIYSKIFAHLDQFSGNVPLEHWVSRIAVNTCLNHLKHERIRPELRMSDLREEEEQVVRQLLHTTDEVATGQEAAARELLDRMLACLRPDERLVVTMLHLEERTVREISQATGWSVTLVKVKAFRTRQKLRRLWRSLADEELS